MEELNLNTTKKCNRCDLHKPIEDFILSSKRPSLDGRIGGTCAPCRKIQKEYYHRKRRPDMAKKRAERVNNIGPTIYRDKYIYKVKEKQCQGGRVLVHYHDRIGLEIRPDSEGEWVTTGFLMDLPDCPFADARSILYRIRNPHLPLLEKHSQEKDDSVVSSEIDEDVRKAVVHNNKFLLLPAPEVMDRLMVDRGIRT